jgi:3-isopropylmalate dehydratase small subunit
LAPSFSSIYFRNAVNSGLPVLRSAGLEDLVGRRLLETGSRVKIDLVSGKARNLSQNASFAVEPMSAVQSEIFSAGGLFAFGRTTGGRR